MLYSDFCTSGRVTAPLRPFGLQINIIPSSRDAHTHRSQKPSHTFVLRITTFSSSSRVSRYRFQYFSCWAISSGPFISQIWKTELHVLPHVRYYTLCITRLPSTVRTCIVTKRFTQKLHFSSSLSISSPLTLSLYIYFSVFFLPTSLEK
jgi:hypothetical protein